MTKPITREQVVSTARQWDGVPWRHQGRTERGVDCAGLLLKVAHTLDVTDFDITNYQRRPQKQKLLEYFKEHMKEISLTQLEAGDVIIFRDNAYPCHVAIVTLKHSVLHIIHAHATRRRVLEEPLSKEWKDKWVTAFRFKALVD